jgi:AAA-like domain
MNFNLDNAIQIANQLTYRRFQRNLTDVEIVILRGAWERQEYDQIAAQNQYATSYISQDVAPKLWKLLTELLGEKVRKSNFKEALKRCWEDQALTRQRLNIIASTTRKTQHDVSFITSKYDTKNEENNHESKSQQVFKNLTPDIYVDRSPVESLCYQTLLQPGSLIRIKAPKLMGKTYFVTQVLAEVAKQNYQTVNLSFELAERSIHFTNLNKFLRWFCLNLNRELGRKSDLDDYWDEEGMGAKVSCTTYFEESLLAQTDAPLVLCLDDVDLLFAYPHIYEDFFGLLRSWYEKARSRTIWKKLRLIIVHSTNVYIELNINQSPFNVGLPIELSEFSRAQVNQLAMQHQLDIDSGAIEQLMELVGGHPYLLELAFAHLKSQPNISLEQLLADATTDAGIYAHHLREYWLNLHINPELVEAYKQVITTNRPVQLEPTLAYQLNSMGLVKISGNTVTPRSNLYRQYFKSHWN